MTMTWQVTNFAHRGIRCLSSNGCRMALPYYCPADHVLRMHYWRGVMPQIPALRIRYREWSVMENMRNRKPRLLAQHYAPDRTMRVAVESVAAARECAHCGERGYVPEGGGGGQGGVSSAALMPADLAARAATSVQLPAGPIELSEAQLKERLGPGGSSARLIHFASLRPGGLKVKLPERAQRLFDDTIRALGGGYCCVEPERRGAHMHFWYDLLWDTPHVDRFGRRWTEAQPWTPTVGP